MIVRWQMTRRELDFYETPAWCIKPAVHKLLYGFGDCLLVCDPAAGNGVILDAVDEYSSEWYGGNLMTAGFEAAADRASTCWEKGHAVSHTDALRQMATMQRQHLAACIMNPPYSHAQEFVTAAIGIYPRVAALLRLGFLASRKRHDWWKRHSPDAIAVLSARPSFTGDGKVDATDYMWAFWGVYTECDGIFATELTWLQAPRKAYTGA